MLFFADRTYKLKGLHHGRTAHELQRKIVMDYVLHQPATAPTRPPPALPGQVVLVFQGGGALGAYQGGVYAALHEAGIEPNWVIGTSIGAVNGAIIAGNDPEARLPRLREFWSRMEHKPFWGATPFAMM